MKKRREPLVRTTPRSSKLRNTPCHCGSGKKFKRCHGLAPALKPKREPTAAELLACAEAIQVQTHRPKAQAAPSLLGIMATVQADILARRA